MTDDELRLAFYDLSNKETSVNVWINFSIFDYYTYHSFYEMVQIFQFPIVFFVAQFLMNVE